MSLIQAVILGVVQGFTEFLPISSSGHLILGQSLLQLDFSELKGFDIALHFGTLLVIFIYFRADFWRLIKGYLTALTAKNKATFWQEKEVKQVHLMIIASFPALLIGFFWGDAIDDLMRNPLSVAIMLMAVGLIFLLAEYVHTKRKKGGLNAQNTILIGCAQALALIPGVSRSGATISAGLALGLSREEAARFSFLLGSIAISAASAFAVLEVAMGKVVLPDYGVLAAGVISSFVAGWLAVSILMRYLKKNTLAIFAIYRLIVGAIFIVLLLS